MPAAERVALEAIARPIAKLYLQRATAEVKSAPSMMTLLRDVLQRGCFAMPAQDYAALRLTAMQQWVVDVAWLLQTLNERIGVCAADVLVARLTRPQQTVASGFDRIAGDVSEMVTRRTGQSTTLLGSEADTLYQRTLPQFVALLTEREIGREPRVDAPTHAAYRPWQSPESQHRLIAIGRKLQRFARRRTRNARRSAAAAAPAN